MEIEKMEVFHHFVLARFFHFPEKAGKLVVLCKWMNT